MRCYDNEILREVNAARFFAGMLTSSKRVHHNSHAEPYDTGFITPSINLSNALRPKNSPRAIPAHYAEKIVRAPPANVTDADGPKAD